ncbi:nuclear pore complex protein Nup214 [Toxorhynchites rutilus septentrionalis]|uniref:nuclear pore complex protein Nup214 n=1 Tax=Toxorhynchites rutilus septentrionalis TaxID=329112 RepID=UPI0024786932|nr:nuclear pore complex protein Nup214 [Toxorhynchites rutilus septentrionalis]
MATTAPEGLDVTNLKFKLQSKVPIFKGNGNVQNGCNLLAAASVHGLIFAGATDRNLRVLQLKDITQERVIDEIVPLRTIALPSEPFQLAVSSDHSLLAVDVSVNGVSFIYIYAVASFLTASIVKLQEIRTSPEANVRGTQILWNPVIHNIFSLRAENGALSVYTLKEQSGLEFHSLDKNEKAICACWSPKGKQLVVGFANGKLVQYKPDLKPARTIMCPSGVLEGNFDVIALQWLSTYQFAAVFLPHAEDSVPALFIINAPKSGNPVFINYDDICYSQSGPRRGQVFLLHIVPWNLLLMASVNSMEVGILGTTESGETPTWCQWTTTDEARAELPLTSDKQESFPVGLVLETGCTHQVTIGEQTFPVMPMIHLLSTYGLLVSFNVLNLTPNAPSLCSPPKPISDMSGKFEKIDFNNRVKPVAAPASSAEISFAVPVGATSTPAIAKTKSFFSPSENKSPMNLFGGNTATSVAGTNATTITPSFGKQITFGGAPPAAAIDAPKPVAFGSSAANQVPTPPQTPQSQLKTFSSQAVKAPEPSKPLVTVPSTYTPTPATEVIRSASVGSVSQQTQQRPAQRKPESSDDTNLVIRSMITEEINKIHKELLDLQNRCKSLSIDVGSKEDSAKIIKNLKELQDLSVQAAESTESLISDVQALRLGLNEAFAMVAEANSKNSIYKHPSPNQFQETHAMSQSSRRQLASLQNMFAVNENQLQIINKQIDAQWSSIQQANDLNSKRRMHVPSLEVLYQTLKKQQEILNRHREKLGLIKRDLGMRENIRGLEKGKMKEPPNETAIDSLTDSIISMTIADKVREDACRMNETKMSSLRNMLRNRKITIIKPGRPDRVGLNSEVVRERRNEVRRLHLEKEKVMTEAASPITCAPAVSKTMEEKFKPRKEATPVKAAPIEPTKSFELPKASAVPSFAPKPIPDTNVSAAIQPIVAAQTMTTTASFNFTPTPVNSNIKNPTAFGATMTANANINNPAAYSFGPISQPSDQPFKPKEQSGSRETTIFGNTTIKPVPANPTLTMGPKEKEPQELPSKPTISFGFTSSSVQNITKPEIFSSAPDFAKPAMNFGSNNNTSKQSSVFSFGLTNTGPLSFGPSQPPTPVDQTPVSIADVAKENQSEAKNNDKPKNFISQEIPMSTSKNDEAVKASFPGITSLLQKDDRNKTEPPRTPSMFVSVAKPTTVPAQASSTATNLTSTTPVFGKNTTTGTTIPSSATSAPPVGLFSSLSFGAVTSTANASVQSSPATMVSTMSAAPVAKTSSNMFGSIQPPAAPTANIGVSFGSSETHTKPTDLSIKADTQKTQTSVVFGVTTPTFSISTTSTGSSTATTTAVTAAAATTAALPTTSSISFGFAATVSSTAPTSSTQTTVPTASNVASTTDSTANLFGSFTICSPHSTSATSTTSNIFGSTSFSVPKATVASIFGGNATATPSFVTDTTQTTTVFSTTPVATSASTPGTGLFGSVTSDAGGSSFGKTSASSPFAMANTAPSTNVFGSVEVSTAPSGVSTGSIFGGGGSANNGASYFGGIGSGTPTTAASSVFASNTGGSLFGTIGSTPPAAAGGSIFGGTSSFGNTSNIFAGATTSASVGGFGAPAFGQPSSPQSAQSIFGGSANTTGFGNTSFGSPAPVGGSFSQPAGGSVSQSGFGSPTSSAFDKPAFGGAPAFAGAPTFGGTPTFGGAPSFGSPPTFGSKPTFGTPSGFGQAPISPSTQSNNLFEQLGSSSSGVSFGNLAQQPTQKPPQFGGSSFSSWRS